MKIRPGHHKQWNYWVIPALLLCLAILVVTLLTSSKAFVIAPIALAVVFLLIKKATDKPTFAFYNLELIKDAYTLRGLASPELVPTVAQIYFNSGYSIQLLPSNHTYQILASQAGKKRLVRILPYSVPVSQNHVIELVQARVTTQADSATVVTSGSFPDLIKQYAGQNHVFLVDGDLLLSIIKDAGRELRWS